jgi:hypothetical protein
MYSQSYFMVSIEGDNKHRLKGTNWKRGKCRLERENVQNGVAAYKFLRDRHTQIVGESERYEEESLLRSLSVFVEKQGYC